MANVLEIIVRLKDESSNKLKNLTKEGSQFEKKLSGMKNAAASMIAPLTAITGGVIAAGAALKKFYEIGKEGAQLEMMSTRFDRLAKSIGTTGDALMIDLKEATKGLLSDSELVQSATDFMSLGLAKTHDEAVRLARVSSALGMNMNQLVLTLTNQTTMRFDALGISVDGFDEKVKKLVDSGEDVNRAFKLAFLEQAEDQIARVGDVADTSAGKIAKLEAAVKNMSDRAKKDAAPAIAWFADEITKLIYEQELMIEVGDQLDEAVNRYLITDGYRREVIRDLVRSGGDYNAILHDMLIIQSLLNDDRRESIELLDAQKQFQQGVNDVTGNAAGVFNALESALKESNIPLGQQVKLLEELKLLSGETTQADIELAESAGYLTKMRERGLITDKEYIEFSDKLSKGQLNQRDLINEVSNLIENRQIPVVAGLEGAWNKVWEQLDKQRGITPEVKTEIGLLAAKVENGTLTADGFKEALAELESQGALTKRQVELLGRAIDGLHDKTVTIKVNYKTTGIPNPAAGDIGLSPGSATVPDTGGGQTPTTGPTLVTPKGGTTTTGGVIFTGPINIYIDGAGDPQATGQAVVKALENTRSAGNSGIGFAG